MKKRKDKYGRVLKEGESLRKDGRYQYRYKTIDNKCKTVYARSLDDLRVKEQEIQNDLYNGFCTADRNVTVHEMFIRCASSRQFLKPRSREVYEYCYNKHAKPILGDRLVRDIKYSDMMMFFKYMRDELHLGISTMRSVNHSLTPIFKAAVRDGIIRTDPIEGVFAEIKKMYSLKQNKRYAVPKEQLKSLVNFISTSKKDSRYLNIFLTLMLTGVRVSEMCALTWDDVDFDNNVIHINKSMAYTKNGGDKMIRLIQTPKTESGNRTIPMFIGLREVLLNQKQSQANLPPIVCGGYRGFVFGNKNNLPYTAERIESAFRKMVKHYNEYEAKQAETEGREPYLLDNCTPHQLRHSYCVVLCENDVNIKVIQEVMGHANVSTSLNVYAEVSAAKKHTELSRIEEKFNQLSQVI